MMTIENLIELGVDKDIAEKVAEVIRAATDDLKTVHKSEVDALRKEMDAVLIGAELERAIRDAGVWSEKAVYALLEPDRIRVVNGVVCGVSEEIERIRAECGVLFKESGMPMVVSCASDTAAGGDDIMRGVMGI